MGRVGSEGPVTETYIKTWNNIGAMVSHRKAAPTTLSVEPKTRDRLRTFGHAGMSYDEILRRLMDQVDKERFLASLHRQADQETGWVELDDFDWGS